MSRLASPASAVLLLLAFPPFNLSFIAFVALAPLLAAIIDETPPKAFRKGYAFGLVYMLGQMHWLKVLVERWTDNSILAFVPWIVAALAGALYFGLFAWLAERCFRRGLVALVPLLWAGVEVFRAYIPGLAFPWGLLADPLWPYPAVIQSAFFGSVFLVSAWVAVPSVVLALWLRGNNLLRARPLILVFGFLMALSLVRYSADEPTESKVVTIGQLGVDMAFGDPSTEPQRIASAVERIYAVARQSGSELLVLPEGITSGGATVPPITPFRIEEDVPVIFGGQRGDGPVYQSAFSFDGRWQFVDKTRLVIFGEFVPGRDWIPLLSAFELPQGDLSPGENVGVLSVSGVTVAPLLCFEALFPDIAYRQAAQGAQMIAVLSIDDWYMGTSAPQQLMGASIWRAVETGLPLVRAASQGHSIAVDGKGRVLVQAPLKDTVAARVELPIGGAATNPWLPAFPVACLGCLAYVMALPWLNRLRRIRGVEVP